MNIYIKLYSLYDLDRCQNSQGNVTLYEDINRAFNDNDKCLFRNIKVQYLNIT